MQQNSTYLKEVRDQYENYPYPARNPEDEKKRLRQPKSINLNMLNFYCFQGKANFSNGFRVLIAGGGTGDAAIYMAEQLRDMDAEVVYLDMSEASMQVCQQRAKVRGLENIMWHHQSLLDIPKSDLGEFDFIDCSGVLHHLADPDEGLKALACALKPQGAMNIMVYGQYGRMAIYQTQELMRRIHQNNEDNQQRVEDTKEVLRNLPESNWFKQEEKKFADLHSDIGTYDLLLHSQDRAYTVPQVYDWLKKAELDLISFTSFSGQSTYMPETYLSEGALLEKIQSLPQEEQQAIAELLNSRIICHEFYASKQGMVPVNVDDLENVPFIFMQTQEETILEQLKQMLRQQPVQTFFVNHSGGGKVAITSDSFTYYFLKHMDGQKTLVELYQAVQEDPERGDEPVTQEQLHQSFRKFFDKAVMVDWLLLRHKSVPVFPEGDEMQRRIG